MRRSANGTVSRAPTDQYAKAGVAASSTGGSKVAERDAVAVLALAWRLGDQGEAGESRATAVSAGPTRGKGHPIAAKGVIASVQRKQVTPSTRSPGVEYESVALREAACVAVNDERVIDLVNGEPGHPKPGRNEQNDERAACGQRIATMAARMPWVERRTLREKPDELPDRPGVYLYRNAASELLYVGKAKSLSLARPLVLSAGRPARAAHRRASSSEVADLETIVVETRAGSSHARGELHQEGAAALQRDPEGRQELPVSQALACGRVPARFARCARRVSTGTSITARSFPLPWPRRSLKMIPRFFQVATCDEVFDGKRRPCLYYHLDQCLGAVRREDDPEEYGRAVADAKLFLEGRHKRAPRRVDASHAGRVVRARSTRRPRATATRFTWWTSSACARRS